MSVKLDKRFKRNQLVRLTAKTEAGKAKLSYHDEKWHLIDIAIPPFLRKKGECYYCRSRDGKQVVLIQLIDDPDIELQKL